jgi:hypothetical protein
MIPAALVQTAHYPRRTASTRPESIDDGHYTRAPRTHPGTANCKVSG